jgi:hypothetical protein
MDRKDRILWSGPDPLRRWGAAGPGGVWPRPSGHWIPEPDPDQFNIVRSVGEPAFLADVDPRREVPAVIRIQLVAMDAMLSDMITALFASEPDISVGKSGTISQAMASDQTSTPDVLLLQDGRSGDGLMALALAPQPPAILCITANGREGWTLRFAADRQPIDETEGGLAAVVRRAADRPGSALFGAGL